MFTAGIGHTAILNNRIAERANLRAFILVFSLKITVFSHLDRLIQTDTGSLIIGKVYFIKLLTINFIP